SRAPRTASLHPKGISHILLLPEKAGRRRSCIMNAVDVPVREKTATRWMVWAGRVISLWPVFVVLMSAIWKLTRNPWYVGEFARIGWQESSLKLLAFLPRGCA